MLLTQFRFSVNRTGTGGMVGRSMWVKDLNIHISFLTAAAEISNRAPSSMFEVNCSPILGCNYGSTVISWQTSVSKLAVKSCISL